MRTAQQERDEVASRKAWDKLWTTAMAYIICDKLATGTQDEDFTEEENSMLALIDKRRRPWGKGR